jgi:hypothetical protein
MSRTGIIVGTNRPAEVEEVSVRCPRCKGLAKLDTPWESYQVNKVASPADTTTDHGSKGYVYIERGTKGGRWVLLGEKVPDLEGRSYYLSGNYLVFEKYPHLMHREQFTRENERYRVSSIIKCTSCYLVDAYLSDWPQDAYFQWDIRGHTLWAYSREHAKVLLEFIKSTERDETQFGSYEKSLRKLPTHFISAKMRDLIVKEISATLETTRPPSGR